MIKRTLSTLTVGLLLALGIGLAPTTTAQAQDLNAGYIFEQALIVNMPQYQQVQQQLQKQMKSRRQQMQKQMQEFQKKAQRFQKQQSLLSEKKRKQRQQELRKMKQKLQRSRQQQQQAMMKKRQTLMQPLYEKLNTALQNVSDEQGIDMVFRGQALAHASDDVVNITPAVASELGIEVPEAPEPGATPETEPPASPTPTTPLPGGGSGGDE